MVTIPDLSRLSGVEKDALILALLERLETAERRIAELEAKLNEPPKTPDNSSVPPSRGVKASTARREKRRDRRDGPGASRRLAAAPDRTVSFKASHCPHCAAVLDQDAQTLRAVYDRIEVPEIRPHVTRIHLFGGTCACCAGTFIAAPEPGLEPGSPFGRSVEALVIYLHAVHAISFQRLSRLLDEVFGLSISEGAIANILARSQKPFLDQAEAITEQVRRAEVIGCDETSARAAPLGTGLRHRAVRAAHRPAAPGQGGGPGNPGRPCAAGLGVRPLWRPAGPWRRLAGLPGPFPARHPVRPGRW